MGNKKTLNNNESKELINRNKALKKLGKYAGITALGTFMILSPKASAQTSTPPEPGGGFF